MPQKLLLADDSVTIQRVIELTFADEDIQVTVVGDGRHAIERLKAERPDIVLADIGMPEKDGYEVAAFIKSDPQFSHIPVILLTGAFEPLDENRARSVGCDGVLVKPFEPQMVINRVKELLAGQRPPASMASSVRTPSHVEDLEAILSAPTAAPLGAKQAAAAESLDDYFERLDAAFADMGPAAAPGAEKPPFEREDLASGLAELQTSPSEPPSRTEDPLTTWDPELVGDFGPARQPHLANAFAALLAAEEGHPLPHGAAVLAAPPQRLSDEMIEDIVHRVIARMSEDTVRRTIIETAERLVREEIDRIKHASQGH
jgi:CheY-like chemotaxis protein